MDADSELNDPGLIDAATKTAEPPEPEIDYSKIDYTKLDPTRIPHHIVQMTGPFQGLVADVQTQRTKTQELTEQINLLTSELQSKDDEEVKDPNEPVTRGELKSTIENVVNKVVSTIEGSRKKDEDARQSKESERRLNESCRKLGEEFTEAKAGKGLDAATVLRNGLPWLAQNEPELLAAARNSSDPARKIYKLALTHVPELMERFDAQRNNQFVETIQTGRIHKGGGAIPGGQKSELVRIFELPEEEILTAIRTEELS